MKKKSFIIILIYLFMLYLKMDFSVHKKVFFHVKKVLIGCSAFYEFYLQAVAQVLRVLLERNFMLNIV